MQAEPGPNRSTDYATLQALARNYWTWRAEHMPLSYDDIPRLDRPEGWVPDWSPATIAQRRRDLKDFQSQLKNIDPNSWTIAQQVDYRLIESALARVNWELDITRGHEVNADFYVHQTLGAVFLSLLSPKFFDSKRCAEIVTRFQSIPVTVVDAQENLAFAKRDRFIRREDRIFLKPVPGSRR